MTATHCFSFSLAAYLQAQIAGYRRMLGNAERLASDLDVEDAPVTATILALTMDAREQELARVEDMLRAAEAGAVTPAREHGR